MNDLTEYLTFYHGTGKAAALSILRSGAEDAVFEKYGARTLGREMRRAILSYAKLSPNEDWRLITCFDLPHLKCLPGMGFAQLWIKILRYLDGDESHYQYGGLFATTRMSIAYSYTIGNPYRSEFIQGLAEALKLLEYIGEPIAKTISGRYPEIDLAIKRRSPPVVLELSGLSRQRLLNDKDVHDSKSVDRKLELYRTFGDEPGDVPLEFKIRDVTSNDIKAVHVLDDWTEEEVEAWDQLDKSKVEASRCSVDDWLAKTIST
jgi:hypothetical protein